MYLKEKIEGTEDFNVINVGEDEMITFNELDPETNEMKEVTKLKSAHYLANGYVEATKEEYEANDGEVVAEPVQETEEIAHVLSNFSNEGTNEAVEAPVEEVKEEVAE